MSSLTVENYLKAILQITIQTGKETVSTGKLAKKMGVLPGTVTSMLKTLSEASLALYTPYEGVALTPQGTALAMRMLRRHRLIELFLCQTLNLNWDQVHEEAENMEHAVSDFVVDRMDEFLGYPKTDPHGDPIPSADGKMRTSTDSALPLAECAINTEIKFVRVLDQDSNFLQELTASGICLGKTGTVLEKTTDAIVIALGSQEVPVSLSCDNAKSILVELTTPTKLLASSGEA